MGQLQLPYFLAQFFCNAPVGTNITYNLPAANTHAQFPANSTIATTFRADEPLRRQGAHHFRGDSQLRELRSIKRLHLSHRTSLLHFLGARHNLAGRVPPARVPVAPRGPQPAIQRPHSLLRSRLISAVILTVAFTNIANS